MISGDPVDIGADERDSEEAGVEVNLEVPLGPVDVGVRCRHSVGRRGEHVL